jgi:hypothetical protein
LCATAAVSALPYLMHLPASSCCCCSALSTAPQPLHTLWYIVAPHSQCLTCLVRCTCLQQQLLLLLIPDEVRKRPSQGAGRYPTRNNTCAYSTTWQSCLHGSLQQSDAHSTLAWPCKAKEEVLRDAWPFEAEAVTPSTRDYVAWPF